MDRTVRTYAPSLLCIALLAAGCQSSAMRQPSPAGCAELERGINFSESVATLNRLTDAFAQQCHATVTEYGARALEEYRHKTFHVITETFSIFLPDGTLTDYVLESYERGFLSLLLAASYASQEKDDDARVELRRLDHELFSPLYNYGEDPVNILLSAVLWEYLDEPGEARVDWLRLRDIAGLLKQPDKPLRAFAERQIKRIDEGRAPGPVWQLYGIGTFPGIDWDLQFTGSDSGYFLVTAKGAFLPACVSETGALISTGSWFEKIALRHNGAYHPLLNVQSWIRLPVGVTYSLVPGAAGAGIAVGGCMLDAAGKGKGALCEVAVRGGVVLMSTAPGVFKWALEPDLRHWERLPAAFLVTTAPVPALERCASGEPSLTMLKPRMIRARATRHE